MQVTLPAKFLILTAHLVSVLAVVFDATSLASDQTGYDPGNSIAPGNVALQSDFNTAKST